MCLKIAAGNRTFFDELEVVATYDVFDEPDLAAEPTVSGDDAVTVGSTLTLTTAYTTGEGARGTYAIVLEDGAPEGAVFNEGTGTLTWTPAVDQIGSFTFTFVVSRSGSTDDTKTWSVSKTVTVNEASGETVFSGATAADATVGTELSLAYAVLAGGAAADGWTIALSDFSPAAVTGTPAMDAGTFTWTPGWADVGDHTFTVTATKDGEEALTKDVSVHVGGEPVLMMSVGSSSVKAYETFTRELSVQPTVEEGAFTYSVVSVEPATLASTQPTIEVNAETNTLSWTPPYLACGHDTTITVKAVCVYDASITATQSVTVTVGGELYFATDNSTGISLTGSNYLWVAQADTDISLEIGASANNVTWTSIEAIPEAPTTDIVHVQPQITWNGIISWHPTVGDMGLYRIKAYYTGAAEGDTWSRYFRVAVAPAGWEDYEYDEETGPVEDDYLFHEDFSACSTKWANTADMTDAYSDQPGWLCTSGEVLRAQSSMRLGNTSVGGVATSAPITNTVAVQRCRLSFDVARQDDTNVVVRVLGEATGNVIAEWTVPTDEIPALSTSCATLQDAVASNVSGVNSASFSYEFETYEPVRLEFASEGRILLDRIYVLPVSYGVETYVLATPEPTVTSRATNSFSVTWPAVDHADGYEAVVDGESVTVVDNGDGTFTACKTGCDPNTEYTMSICAKTSDANYDEYSESIDVDVCTLAATGAPVFTSTALASYRAGEDAAFSVTAAYYDENETWQPLAVSYEGADPAPAGGAAYDSATGAFTWSPEESEVGTSFSFTFSATNGEGESALTETLVVTATVTTGQRIETLLEENFSGVSGTFKNTQSNLSATDCDMTEWSFSGSIGKGPGCARVGGSGSSGSITTPTLTPHNSATHEVVLSLHAACTNTTSKLTVKVVDAESGEELLNESYALAPYDASASNIDADAFALGPITFTAEKPFTIEFSGSRVWVDAISCTQVVDRDLATLATPENFSFENDPFNVITATWDPVEGAGSYDVIWKRFDVYGDIDLEETYTTDTASITLTDLLEQTQYVMSVRAQPGSARWEVSEWSEEQWASTEADPSLPMIEMTEGSSEFYLGEEGSFTMVATVASEDGASVPVTLTGVEGVDHDLVSTPAFDSETGVFTWTPAVGDPSSAVAHFSATSSAGRERTYDMELWVSYPELEAPTPVCENALAHTLTLGVEDPNSTTMDYQIKIWTGSDGENEGVSTEYFVDYDMATPAGWEFEGDASLGGEAYETRVVLASQGAAVVSRSYEAAVSYVSWQMAGGTNAVVRAFGSADGGETWTALGDFKGPGESGTPECTLTLETDALYTRFRFELVSENTEGAMNIGLFSFTYEGAGPQYLVGSAEELATYTPEELPIVLGGLKPGTDYFMLLSVRDYVYNETYYAGSMNGVMRFTTPAVNKAAVVVVH